MLKVWPTIVNSYIGIMSQKFLTKSRINVLILILRNIQWGSRKILRSLFPLNLSVFPKKSTVERLLKQGGGNAAVKKNKLGTFTSYKLQVVSQTAKAGAKAFLTLQPGICNLRKLSLTSNRYFL